jgi:DNA-binding helix-hairpin-helix protein with protein kinase domain
VIGDINHSGILISENALATLIDCDSFQVQVAGKTFLCKVGVPDFTPPELQGKRFDQILRTTNHDAFGLAVVLFNLLFMGRHPFAGRFLGRGDMPLETAIAQYQFAYSARKNETRTEPPPSVPLLADIPQELAAAFEISFGQLGVSSGRPRAAEWAGILKRAEGEVIQCAESQAHQYFRTAACCPWCRMESAYPGFLAFAPPFISVVTAPINLGQLIAAIRGVPDPGVAPDLAATMPLFKGTVSQVATFSPKDLIVRYGVAMVGVLVSVVLFRLQQPAPLLGLLTLAGSAFLAARESKSAEAAKKAVSQTAAAWKNVETQWNRVKENREFLELRGQADHLITQTQTLGGEESRLLAGLKAKQKEAQLTQFLQQFYIAHAKIKGIGRSRKIVLRSYGIETAADVAQNRIQQISGFGPVVEGTLIAWRKSIEKRFVFNPNQPISPADIAAIKAAVLKKKSQLESDLRQSLARLQNASNGTRSIRNSLKASAVQIWNAQKQAHLNATVLINRFTVKARLAGLAAVMAVSLILLNAIGSPSNPVPPRQNQRQVDITKQPSQPEPNAEKQEQQPRRMGEGSAPPTSLDNGPSNTNVPGDVSAPNPRPSDATPQTGERAKPTPAPESTAKVEGNSRVVLTDLTKKDEARRVQQRLIELGYLNGVADGIWGPLSQRALQEFRTTMAIGNDNSWDERTQHQLFSESAKRSPAVPKTFPPNPSVADQQPSSCWIPTNDDLGFGYWGSCSDKGSRPVK